MSFKTIYHDATSKLVRFVIVMLFLGSALFTMDALYFHESFHLRDFASAAIHELSIALIIAAILVVVVDVGFRQELLEDISHIFRYSNNNVFLDKAVLSRRDILETIADDIKRSARGTQIDTIGVVAGSLFTVTPGNDLLVKKIIEGVHFRVLMMHPDSKLLPCIERESLHGTTSNLTTSSFATAIGALEILMLNLTKKTSEIRGSLEVRLYRDVMSSGYLYSGSDFSVFSPYLAHKRGELCPAFTTLSNDYRAELQSHFDYIWEQTDNFILAKANRETLTSSCDGLRG
ncbi:hypothetical protein [Rhodopseudomonas sp. AAP120]|uniref:hypothetical protein n=1 Tax=Rhodopseudomonas sp. AAP120 TaxID=1523430 RepID=UPI000A7423F7|nr:hypothetical protein [Rhodopseudomonas sp. AAP120]